MVLFMTLTVVLMDFIAGLVRPKGKTLKRKVETATGVD